MRQLLLFPHDLPATIAETRSTTTNGVRALLAALDSGHRSPPAVLEVLAGIPIRPEGVKLDRWEWHARTRRTEQFAILDQFFGVTRATSSTGDLFGHAAALAYRVVLENTLSSGSDLGSAQWNELCWGLERVVRFSTDGTRGVPASAAVPIGQRVRDPHARWRAGHQVFFPLVQATLVGLRCFVSAVLEGSEADACESIAFATDVMRASARALEFASDFDPDTYSGAVRPSMTPPGTPQGLSGLMSADHHEMVGLFQQLRPVATVLDPAARRLYGDFVDTVEQTYQAHVHVCTRFRGDRIVSLRMSHASSMSASAVLEQLGATRVKALRST